MNLSPHFTLEEFTRSFTAQRLGIDNTLHPEEPAHLPIIANLQRLCTTLLEPLRAYANRPRQPPTPLIISSGYRSPALNEAVGGQPRSQHLTGCAADLHLPSLAEGLLWFQWLRQQPEFDELIWERTTRSSPPWIHVALRPEANRRKVITQLIKSP